ncbi:MAG: hypothetical protein WBW76_02410 [Candidatus Cybelea sp.]
MGNTAFRALCASAAFVLLAGCGGSLGAGEQPSVLAPQGAQGSLHGNSLTDAAARGKDLLYASSTYNCNVYVFTYPRGKLVQTINSCAFGFGPAFGLCTDSSGDVFMAMGEGFSIFEFAHGGTKPIAQLEDDSLLPVGCSVDAKTGDLGVASVTGNVAIFKNASGTPEIYSLPNISEFFFCTFDDRGNLFADGEHNDRTFALAELPKGGSALHEIMVSGNVGAGFALQWDGHHIAVGETQASNEFVLDRVRISGSVAKIVGTTALTAAPNTFMPFQFWIQGGTIVQSENGNAEIGFWNYPRGGAQTNGIQIAGSTLVGVTVSLAGRRR